MNNFHIQGLNSDLEMVAAASNIPAHMLRGDMVMIDDISDLEKSFTPFNPVMWSQVINWHGNQTGRFSGLLAHPESMPRQDEIDYADLFTYHNKSSTTKRKPTIFERIFKMSRLTKLESEITVLQASNKQLQELVFQERSAREDLQHEMDTIKGKEIIAAEGEFFIRPVMQHHGNSPIAFGVFRREFTKSRDNKEYYRETLKATYSDIAEAQGAAKALATGDINVNTKIIPATTK